ncbi:hypothetical protein BKA70DRAFT_783872 [Coprinopsis sp. MPI-PUGE-AT-0042]|nr:hypothetical protein BKA70DRAFT_783872 [Coprinopsis sp. MPI-PUGE-AT-0042]
MTLAQYSQGCPSFSLVLEMANGGRFVLNDFQRAGSRQVTFERKPPRRSCEPKFRGDDDRFMRTVDARFEGNLAYQVVYASERFVDVEDGDVQNQVEADASTALGGHRCGHDVATDASSTLRAEADSPKPKSSLRSMFRLLSRMVRNRL